jgi:protein-arginine kinase activator protein McsA
MVVVHRRREDTCRTFVCEECGNERTRLYAGASLDFDRIVARVDRPKDGVESMGYRCRLCGTTLADIVVDGRPGCCRCYARFAGEVEQAVETAQGSICHVGKTFEG